MNWTIVPLDSVTPQPWRNGGGITRELLAWPTAADWQVRLSVADVQSAGPFSRFVGIERWFAVLEGAGVVLRIGDADHRLTTASEPLRFDGGDAVDCTPVRGPTRDFNLMAVPGRATMQRVRGQTEFRTRAQALLALYSHEAGGDLRCQDETLVVPPYHLAWRLAPGDTRVLLRSEDALWLEALA
jgi:uncharacterized protein